MSVTHDPAAVPDELVMATRELGDPAADLVVLSEGNTSVRLPDGRMVVKASGSQMRFATNSDFVVADAEELVDLMERPYSNQADLAAALVAVDSRDGVARRASIESLVHAAALALGGATWVAHTHPTAALATLATHSAAERWSLPLFPDEAVMLGRPMWVPYFAPGIDLGRWVATAMRRYLDQHGEPPRLILLGNHGIVALGQSASDIRAVTTMAVKAARVRALAQGLGDPAYLDEAMRLALATRPDEAYRRGLLSGT